MMEKLLEQEAMMEEDQKVGYFLYSLSPEELAVTRRKSRSTSLHSAPSSPPRDSCLED